MVISCPFGTAFRLPPTPVITATSLVHSSGNICYVPRIVVALFGGLDSGQGFFLSRVITPIFSGGHLTIFARTPSEYQLGTFWGSSRAIENVFRSSHLLFAWLIQK